VIVGVLVGSDLLAGGLGAMAGRGVRDGVMAALWNAIAGYMSWYPLVLIGYHAFSGTAGQDRAVRAEGTYQDFARSGMGDLKAFVLQDLFGAGFDHLILGTVLALLFGSAAAATVALMRRPGQGGGAA
jgi:hypothetical protein